MNRQDIIAQAQSCIEDGKRLLAESGLTPQACFDRLRELGGEAAVDKVRREVAETVQGIQQQIRRDILHAVPNRLVSRYVAQRGGV